MTVPVFYGKLFRSEEVLEEIDYSHDEAEQRGENVGVFSSADCAYIIFGIGTAFSVLNYLLVTFVTVADLIAVDIGRPFGNVMLCIIGKFRMDKSAS